MAAKSPRGVQIWCGETATASGGGLKGVSDRFQSTLWFLDELVNRAVCKRRLSLGSARCVFTPMRCVGQGQLAEACPPAGCVFLRQTFTGANCSYCMVDDEFRPNPDFYAAVLWKRLVGRAVLGASSTDPHLRAYAHCAAAAEATGAGAARRVVLVLINLRNASTTVTLSRADGAQASSDDMVSFAHLRFS